MKAFRDLYYWTYLVQQYWLRFSAETIDKIVLIVVWLAIKYFHMAEDTMILVRSSMSAKISSW